MVRSFQDIVLPVLMGILIAIVFISFILYVFIPSVNRLRVVIFFSLIALNGQGIYSYLVGR